jgi:hypothetical protein
MVGHRSPTLPRRVRRTSPYLRAARYSMRITGSVRPASHRVSNSSEGGRANRLGEPLIRVVLVIRCKKKVTTGFYLVFANSFPCRLRFRVPCEV